MHFKYWALKNLPFGRPSVFELFLKLRLGAGCRFYYTK